MRLHACTCIASVAFNSVAYMQSSYHRSRATYHPWHSLIKQTDSEITGHNWSPCKVGAIWNLSPADGKRPEGVIESQWSAAAVLCGMLLACTEHLWPFWSPQFVGEDHCRVSAVADTTSTVKCCWQCTCPYTTYCIWAPPPHTGVQIAFQLNFAKCAIPSKAFNPLEMIN